MKEQEQLQQEIEKLQKKISRYELAEQRSREIQNRLDMQVDMFRRIHKCALSAFATKNTEELNTIIAEGVVDIFQLELGAVFLVSVETNCLTLAGHCNVKQPDYTIPLESPWVTREKFWNFKKQGVLWEAPPHDDSPLKALNLACGIYAPLFNYSQKFEGLILGAIRESSKQFYDFHPEDIQSSFMVFAKQMNGIINNNTTLKKAYEAEQSKTRFLANLSHEMRTPLNAVLGMAQISSQNESLDRYREAMRQIKTSSQHLLGLINNVLDLAKINENKIQLASEPFDLKELINMVMINVNPHAREKHQNIQVSFKNISDFNLFGDRLRLSQVLLNLLSNAVKFTPEHGSITLGIQENSRDDQKVLFHFFVQDAGTGIPQNFYEKLFIPFEQAEGHDYDQKGGTGLGLAISYRIVELMGGTLQVENLPEQGARFYFDAWFVPDLGKDDESNHTKESQHLDLNLSGKTILLVDDIEVNRIIIQAMLENTRAKVEMASDGRQALEMVSQSSEGYYDIILMDVQMPIMNGLQCTQEIRKLNRKDAKSIPILAMTANAYKEDIQKSFESGMNGHISKPVEHEVLLKELQKKLLGPAR